MAHEPMDFADDAALKLRETFEDSEELPFLISMRVRRLAALSAKSAATVVRAQGFERFGDYLIAALLRREDRPMQPSEIADRLMITRAGVTGRQARLLHAGVIVRTLTSSDGRAVNLELTPSGRQRTDAAFRGLREQEAELTADLTGPQLSQLADHLRTVIMSSDPAPTE